MPFIRVEATVRVCLHINLVGHETVLCFNVKYPSAPTHTTLTDLAAAVRDWWETDLSPLLAPQAAFLSVTAKNLDVEDGEEYVLDSTTVSAGTYAGNSLPNQAALVVTWRTLLSGRSYRGRTYIPGVPYEALASDNTVSGDYQEAVAIAFGTLWSDIAETNGTLCVLSRFHNGVERETPVMTPVETQTVNTKIDTQRRRLRGAT